MRSVHAVAGVYHQHVTCGATKYFDIHTVTLLELVRRLYNGLYLPGECVACISSVICKFKSSDEMISKSFCSTARIRDTSHSPVGNCRKKLGNRVRSLYHRFSPKIRQGML